MIMILITIKSIPSIYLNPKNKSISPAGNRTPVSRVTGGDTDHYTTEELLVCVRLNGLCNDETPLLT